MGVYRSNLSLRISPCPAADRAVALMRRVAAVEGASVVRAMDGEEAQRLVETFRAHHIDARAMHLRRFSTADGAAAANAETLAWMHGEASPVLVVPEPMALFSGAPRRAPRAYFMAGLPDDLGSWSRDFEFLGLDGMEVDIDVFAARDDVARRTASWETRGRLFVPMRPSSSWLAGEGEKAARFWRTLLRRATLVDGSDAALSKETNRRPDAPSDVPPAMEGRRFWIDFHAAGRDVAMAAEDVAKAFDRLASTGRIAWVDPSASASDAAWVEGMREGWRKALGASLAWAESTGCWWAGLCRVLGEPFDRRCGHCGWCWGRRPGLLP